MLVQRRINFKVALEKTATDFHIYLAEDREDRENREDREEVDEDFFTSNLTSVNLAHSASKNHLIA